MSTSSPPLSNPIPTNNCNCFSSHIENLVYFDTKKSPYILFYEKIGAGGFGKVFAGKYKAEKLAIKVLKDMNIDTLNRELKMMSLCKHINCPVLYGVNPKCKCNGQPSISKFSKKSRSNENQMNIISELINGYTFDEFSKTNINDNIQEDNNHNNDNQNNNPNNTQNEEIYNI